MPIDPNPTIMEQKYGAALSAFNHVQSVNPVLAAKLKADFAGFNYTSKLRADVAEVRKISPTDAAMLDSFYSDPRTKSFLGQKTLDGLGGVLSGLGSAVGAVGTATAQAGQGTGIGLATATEPLAGIAGILSTLTNKNTWMRIGEGLLGIILIAIAVSSLAKNSDAAQTATKTAAKAVKYIK